MNKSFVLALLIAVTFSLSLTHERPQHPNEWYQHPWDDPVLNEDELLAFDWLLTNDGGILGTLGFGENGVLTKLVTNNENKWKFDATGALCLTRADGTLTTRFAETHRDWYGKWHLSGRFVLATNGWRHYLTQLEEQE